MPKIQIIAPEQATGRLKEIYDTLATQRGQIAEVHKIQSLRPESIVKHMDLYMEIMFSKSDLSRADREMIAVVVSAANHCQYCQVHHAHALNHYWKDEQKVAQLRNDYKKVPLDLNLKALCEYAALLTINPSKNHDTDYVEILKQHHYSDAAILDATLVISYFNFVNRIVLALGVAIENDGGGGYKY